MVDTPPLTLPLPSPSNLKIYVDVTMKTICTLAAELGGNSTDLISLSTQSISQTLKRAAISYML